MRARDRGPTRLPRSSGRDTLLHGGGRLLGRSTTTRTENVFLGNAEFRNFGADVVDDRLEFRGTCSFGFSAKASIWAFSSLYVAMYHSSG